MKKLLTVLLAVLMVVSSSTAIFAEDDATKKTGDQTVEVNYTVEENFEWTIPATTATLAVASEEKIGEVKLVAAQLAEGKTFEVKATKGKLTKKNTGETITSEIEYTLTVGTTTVGSTATSVLTYTAGATLPSALDVKYTLTADQVKAAKLAGEHKDTVTFTASLTSAS